MTDNNDMPDVICICPSGEKTYSIEDVNSTPELQYIRRSLVPETVTPSDKSAALELVKNAAVYTDRVTIEMTIPEYENILKPALQEQESDLVKALEEYYIPQLRFSMNGHKEFAEKYRYNVDAQQTVHLHNGAANAFEIAIGCIEEAITDQRAKHKERS